MAKGYTQKDGINYNETFSPVAKMTTVRGILALGANFTWPIHQMDINNAFLQSELVEEVFVDIPLGCDI